VVLSADQRDPGRFGDKEFSPLVPVTSITHRRVEVRIGQARAGIGLRYHRRVVRLGTLAIAVLLAACSGEIQSDIYEDLNPKDQVALEKWVEKALPVLSTKCVECHGGSMPMVAYLAGADDIAKRDTLIAYMPAVINLTAPMSSRMLTKGNHTGPALEAKEASDILSWIVAERDARGATTTVIRSEKFMAMLCTAGNPGDATCPINTVDLTALGQPATLEVVVTQLVADLYLTNIQLKAGAAGLHVTHPTFESWPAGATEPKPDSIDRWFNVDLNIAPNMAGTIGTGEGSFTGFGAGDPLSIRFDIFEMQKAM
jgi:hypothetical protein